MRNIFKPIMLVATVVTAFACSKPDNTIPTQDGKLTLQADRPAIETESSTTRTEIIGGAPYWSVGDIIGVHVHGTAGSNHAFTGDHTEATQTAAFSGSQIAASSTITAYYPYSALGVSAADGLYENGVTINLPEVQCPSAVSFDGDADLLVSLPITLDEQGQTVENLRFRRLGGIAKVVLQDNTTGSAITGEELEWLQIETGAESLPLTGHVALDLNEHQLFAPAGNASTAVKAVYDSGTAYAIGDEGSATWLGLYPHTLPAQSKLTVTAKTAGYNIRREIDLNNDIIITAGKITTLNIQIGDADITPIAATTAVFDLTDSPFKGGSAISPSLTGANAYIYDQPDGDVSSNISLVFGKGAGDDFPYFYNVSGSYNHSFIDDNTLTIEGRQITRIEFTVSSTYCYFTADTGEYVADNNAQSYVWTGSSNKVVFTKMRGYSLNLTQVKVTYDNSQAAEFTPGILSVAPASLDFEAAGGSQSIVVTTINNTSGSHALVTSGLSGTLSAEANGNVVTVTATENTGEAVKQTLNIAFAGGNSIDIPVGQKTALPDRYILATSLGSIVAGDKVLIVNGKADGMVKAISTRVYETNSLAGSDVTIADGQISGDIPEDCIWQVGGSGSTRSFYNVAGAVYFIRASGISQGVITNTSNSSWTTSISASTSVATLSSSVSGRNKRLSWSGEYFTTITSTPDNIYIFKKI